MEKHHAKACIMCLSLLSCTKNRYNLQVNVKKFLAIGTPEGGSVVIINMHTILMSCSTFDEILG